MPFRMRGAPFTQRDLSLLANSKSGVALGTPVGMRRGGPKGGEVEHKRQQGRARGISHQPEPKRVRADERAEHFQLIVSVQ